MSEYNEITAQDKAATDADAVLSLQETPSDDQEVEGHAMGLSTISGSIIGKCG